MGKNTGHHVPCNYVSYNWRCNRIYRVRCNSLALKYLIRSRVRKTLNSKTVDTLHTVETPEGALLQIAVAGPVIRGMAWFVDVIIRMVVLGVVFFAVASFSFQVDSDEAIVGLFLILQFLVTWFYTTAFEAITGTTPGKRLYGLWVIHDNATPITWPGAITRNFLRSVDSLPFFNIAGLVTMLIDGKFRRLGDLAAGTLVTYKEKPVNIATFEHHVGSPPPDWLTRDERIAIVDFAERSAHLSGERQLELAGLLEHLIPEGDDKVSTLKSWAHWIIRGQKDVESTKL